MAKRKIGIYTGNRAEYGLQYPIIKAIDAHPDLEYYLFVSGAHLDPNFGNTREEIANDGFKIYAEVPITLEGDTLRSTTEAIGSGILGLTGPLEDLDPDIFVVYADRFEGFSALITSTQMGIPTAHIEGGDITEGGALDDMVRHSMTKLAHLHFTTNEEAADRIKKMGEEEWRVINAGFPTMDLIKEGKFATEEEIIKCYELDPERPVISFSQHSITTEYTEARDQLGPSLEAINELSKEGYQVVMSYPNNDAGGMAIIDEILNLDNNPNIKIHSSLGRYNYHGMLNFCKKNGVYAGNSSSGIKETPAFGIPAIDIGARQKGRLRAENVINVGYSKDEIYSAIKKGIEDLEYRKLCAECVNPYGMGNSGNIIADTLAKVELGKKLIQKKMTY